MPKSTRFSLMLLLIASVLMVLSCGSGDQATGERTNPIDLVSGGGGSGPGGGPTGTCEFFWGAQACIGGYNQAVCSSIAQQFGNPATFTPNKTCQHLGYSFCSTGSGYSVCYI